MEAQPDTPQARRDQNRTLLFVAAGLLLLLFLACCALAVIGTTFGALGSFGAFDFGRGRVTARDELAVPAEAPLTLTIDNRVGDVIVRPDASGEVRVEVTRFARSRETLERINVDLGGSLRDVTLQVEGPEGVSNWGVDLVVHVPPQTSLLAEVGVGDLTVEGLEGRFRLQSGVGDIVARELVVREDATFEAGTGDVAVEGTLEAGVTLQANTGAGEIVATLPAEMGFELDASTGTGDIALQGFDLEGGQPRDRPVGDEVHGRTVTDPAGRHLVLSTGVGDITIRTQ